MINQGRFLLGLLSICMLATLLVACNNQPWNNPYSTDQNFSNDYYTSFIEQPKTLDPAKAHSTDEALFISQIYETPLQYHYLLRPYTLVPLIATEVPKPIFLDKEKKYLPANTPINNIAYSVYTVHIRPHIFYQPHPAFAREKNGNYTYHHLSPWELLGKNTLSDFPATGTRELVADDYVYQIKRIADPRVQSPFYGLIHTYIEGMSEYNALLEKKYIELQQQNKESFIDLRQYPLLGVNALDKYTYTIVIKGVYPQFIFWLAMHYFVPIPWEADVFYSQPGMKKHNITFDWYPVGTGPYMLTVNNPNRQMILERNPNFHGELYPDKGMPEDISKGLLAKAGKALPFVDKFIFTLEKESIPRWNKFLQGYYDESAISSDSFNQAISIDENGQSDVTPFLKKKGIRLQTSVSPSNYFMGFNMLDPVVGGNSERARKLRLAIAIALDYEEYIAIFLNGRGIPAQGPIPPSIFGYQTGPGGINPYVYKWVNGRATRRSLDEAKLLLAQAGYPHGRDATTGLALLLNFDVASGSSGDDRSYFAWLRKQFEKLGIELQIRDTQYNRFQDKVRTGQAQIFQWGWVADYPDPENFLFLLYGPNSQVKFGGENSVNYHNPEYDKLFVQMRVLPNGPARQMVIDRMLEILRHDSPWIWGFYPKNFLLSQSWVSPRKPNEMSYNALKYISINPKLRAELRVLWNQPIFWPFISLIVLLGLFLLPVIFSYWRKQHQKFTNR